MIGRMGYPVQPPKVGIRTRRSCSRRHGFAPIPGAMRASDLDLIAADFADAVARLDFDAAEGWLATAFLVAEREVARRAAQ